MPWEPIHKSSQTWSVPRLPHQQHVLLADGDTDLEAGIWSLPKRLAAASSTFVIPPTDPEDMAVLHCTSGTTGMPKGAGHVHNAVLTHSRTGKYVLDFHPDDVFWCTADPGGATGTGADVMKRLAAPMVGGVLSTMLLTLVVIPALYVIWRWHTDVKHQGGVSPVTTAVMTGAPPNA